MPFKITNFDENSGKIAHDIIGGKNGILKNFSDDDSHWIEGQINRAYWKDAQVCCPMARPELSGTPNILNYGL